MKAPKCWTCNGRHWSTQPCAINRPESAINTRPAINEERLTDAINAPAAVVASSDRSGLPQVPLSVDSPGEPSRPVDESPKARGAVARTPNRRSREDYNAYMKEYMARRRHG